ncbi:MAG: methionyl-tRNA formyltransferase [Actinomycetota bacterium]|nr:methionyl-tRNA formyltransferase [Actinomycetota bacterium]
MARIAVAATAPFGADVLGALTKRHEIAYVLTRPDQPKGRGRRVAPPPAKEAAERLGVEVRQPERIEDDFDPGVDAVIVVAYGLLIPEAALERALWLNVHPSLLPRWRGAAPVERALMAGDEETGVTVHRTVKELDAGPVSGLARFAIGVDDTAGDVFARAAELAVGLVDEALETDPATYEPQGEGATYAEKITPADRELDWSRPPQELHDRIRALSPHIGARGDLDGHPVLVWRSRLDDGQLELLEVQPEGKRRMSYDEYLRGRR